MSSFGVLELEKIMQIGIYSLNNLTSLFLTIQTIFNPLGCKVRGLSNQGLNVQRFNSHYQ
jgi:hypothetical protein